MPTDVACPQCGQAFSLPAFPGSLAVLQAVRLQAQLRGVEVACEQCGAAFLFRTSAQQWPAPLLAPVEAPP